MTRTTVPAVGHRLLLAFERQITTWADGGSRSGPPSSGMAALPVEALLAKILKSQAGAPSALSVRSDPSGAVETVFGRERILFANRYTGEILGEGSPPVRSIFHVILGIHRWLGVEGERRKVTRAVTGASNVAFLFLVVSGFYLWWPRKWTWRKLRMVTWFRGGITGRARDWNWHNVTGFWCATPLLLIVLSGVVMSYSWANDLLYRIAGEPARREGARPKSVRENASTASLGLGRAEHTRAERQMSGWRSITLWLPPGASATFSIDQGNGGRPDKRAQLTSARSNGSARGYAGDLRVRLPARLNRSSPRSRRRALRFSCGPVLPSACGSHPPKGSQRNVKKTTQAGSHS